MNAKEILDYAEKIIKRQDIDRELLLFFINSTRKAIVRDKNIRKFSQYFSNINITNGVIDLTPFNIKGIRSVEWQLGDSKIRLDKLYSYEDAIDIYHTLDKVGSTRHYLEMNGQLYLLLVPTEGTININAEVYPSDLSDSINSKDMLTNDLGDAWVYLGAAEYFDMLGEVQSGQFWRQKGMFIVDQYLKQMRIHDTNGVELMNRDPFGSTPTGTNKLQVVYDTVVVDDLDAGGF